MRIDRVSLWAAVLAAGLTGTASGQGQRRVTTGSSGFPAGPAATILSFAAEPASLQPGQSATLRWAAINSDDIAIEPEIGVVPTRGERTVTPARTTTYTLKVTGRIGSDTRSVTVQVAGTTAAPAPTAAGEKQQPVPRAPDGKPDLSGVYMGGFAIRPMDKIPLKPGAEKYKVPAKQEDLGQGALCLPPGVPVATMQPYPLQIVQKHDLVVILYEAYQLFRVIPIGKPHPQDLDPTWMGNSVARWDGDTLVVDVTGFNDKTEIAGYRHTQALHVVERYRRTSYNTINYEATVEDPNVFAAPWRYGGPLVLHPEWDLQEYVCEENNKNYQELFEKK